MKKLLVIISVYLDTESLYDDVFSKIVYSDKYDILLINDNPKIKPKNYTNNKINIGKFLNALKIQKNSLNNNFFLTIDPDDILKDGINWDLLEKLAISLLGKDENTLFINSYFSINGQQISKRKNKPKHIFNPNTIYPINKKLNLKDYDYYINYLEDLCLLLTVTNKSTKFKYINIPFYTYYYDDGISTRDKIEFVDDINNAYKIFKKNKFKINSIKRFYIFFTRIIRLKWLHYSYIIK